MGNVSGRIPGASTKRFAVALSLLILGVGGAGASDDAGMHDFFTSGNGGGGSAAAAPSRAEVAPARPLASRPWAPRERSAAHERSIARAPAVTRPLTVRIHRPTMQVQPKMLASRSSNRPERVSIYEDRTLRRGDAVMTTKGLRVFAGSTSWPLKDQDFVALADASRLDPGVKKVLAELDRSPHG